MIDDRAIIGKNAELGTNVYVGPFAIIEDGVSIGDNCNIASHAIIRKGSILEEAVFVDSFAVVGGIPQDRKFDARSRSGVILRKGVMMREGATVHRSSVESCYTEIGEQTILMAYSHVGHDCKVGKFVNLVNGVLLGGYVTLGDHAYLGGNAVVHPNINLGENVMIGGRSAINLDIPPFLMVNEINLVRGINAIGIKRRGFAQAAIGDLKNCIQYVLCEPGNPYLKAKQAWEKSMGTSELGKTFLNFFETPGKKGCIHSRHFGYKNKE